MTKKREKHFLDFPVTSRLQAVTLFRFQHSLYPVLSTYSCFTHGRDEPKVWNKWLPTPGVQWEHISQNTQIAIQPPVMLSLFLELNRRSQQSLKRFSICIWLLLRVHVTDRGRKAAEVTSATSAPSPQASFSCWCSFTSNELTRLRCK